MARFAGNVKLPFHFLILHIYAAQVSTRGRSLMHEKIPHSVASAMWLGSFSLWMQWLVSIIQSAHEAS